MTQNGLTRNERKATFALASIFSTRMLGLFMIYPVFALYAQDYLRAPGILIGMALGIYGLTQAFMQITFGMLSDKWGRKPVILLGLAIFTLGSFIAATPDIYWIIVGRLLQGTGAIGSTLIATLADLTREEQRTKAMGLLGMTIGLSFMVAIVLGPTLYQWVNMPGLFIFTAILALLGMVITLTVIPTPQTSFHRDTEIDTHSFKSLLKDKALLRLDIGVFCLHGILAANFVSLPIVIHHLSKLTITDQWKLYLPILALAFITMFPMIIITEKKRRMKSGFLFGIFLILFAELGLWEFHRSLLIVGFFLWIFFTAFTFLEATLPSLISKIAPAGKKGTAIGIYSFSQFLGVFVGGAIGGLIIQHTHPINVLLFPLLLSALWLALASTMPAVKHLSTVLKKIRPRHSSEEAKALEQQFLAIPGIGEASVTAEEATAYLKVDKQHFNPEDITTLQ